MVVVAKAAKAIGLLGAGLRGMFAPHARVVLPTLLEKLKEKKQAVMTAINEALDILAEQCISLLEVMEGITTPKGVLFGLIFHICDLCLWQ